MNIKLQNLSKQLLLEVSAHDGDVDIDREYGNLAFNELSPLGADTLGTGHSKSRARAEQAVPRRGFDNSAAQFRSAQK